MTNLIKKLFFAWWLKRFGNAVDRHLEPLKERFFADATGKVLEIGAGTGVNVRYLKKSTDLILLEPNVRFHRSLAALTDNVFPDSLPHTRFCDNSIDTVISSLVLCSVPDVEDALREIKRILKPGGTLRFVEHVAAPPGTWLFRFQRLFSPICQCLGDGCHPERQIEESLKRCGLKIIQLERKKMKINDPLVQHFIAGELQKQ